MVRPLLDRMDSNSRSLRWTDSFLLWAAVIWSASGVWGEERVTSHSYTRLPARAAQWPTPPSSLNSSSHAAHCLCLYIHCEVIEQTKEPSYLSSNQFKKHSQSYVSKLKEMKRICFLTKYWSFLSGDVGFLLGGFPPSFSLIPSHSQSFEPFSWCTDGPRLSWNPGYRFNLIV